jgi:DNA-binding GntR family transcriptional regulator
VHQAITRLEQEQLVVRHLHRGTYVSEFNAQEIRDIYAMRRLVECYAIREAARHYRPEDEPGLLQILERLRHAVERDDAVGAVEQDLAFHRHLCLIAGSRRLLSMWETLVAPFHGLIIIFNTRQSPGDLRQVPEVHMRFVEALRKGDGDEGEREMLRQLQKSECSVLAWRAELESERIGKVA